MEMLIVHFDCKGIVHHDCPQTTNQYYLQVPRCPTS